MHQYRVFIWGKRIEQHPDAIYKREQIGDWEAVTIIRQGHQRTIVTLSEQKGQFLRMRLVKRMTKDSVKEFVISLLSGLAVKTILCDNGKELAAHEEIAEALIVKTYLAHPYASGERGTFENINGLIR